MTSITTYPARSRSVTGTLSIPSQVITTLFGVVPALFGRWRIYRQQRTIESLPEGLLKDIGWPSGANDR